MNTFFKDLLGQTIADWVGRDFDDSFKRELSFFVITVMSIVVFLGTLQKQLGIVRYLGLVSVAMVIYLTLVTIFQAKAYRSEFKPQYQAFGAESYFQYMLRFGLYIFAFNSIPAFHQVYSQVKLPTVRRLKKITTRANLMLLVGYLVFTVAAYISLGDQLQTDSYQIFPNKPHLDSDPNDIYMKVLRAIYSVCLLVAYIVNSIPLKAQLTAEFGMKNNTFTNVVLSAAIAFSSAFFAYVYPNVTSWLSILGALGATSMTVVLPTLCYYKAFRDKKEYKVSIGLAFVWAGLTSAMSACCLVTTVMSMQGIIPTW